jgi:energy-coupling factor transporter ATP-binding protein EcfA2
MKLDRLVLVNWGQLRPGNYDIGDMTLLTGPTGSGKSTMLDGLQTIMTAAYAGIVAYNPGQDEVQQGQRRGKTKRTLESFVVGAEYSKFSRPDGAHGYLAAVFRPSEGEDTAKGFTALIAIAAHVDGGGERRVPKLERMEMIIVDEAALSVDDFLKDAENQEWVAVDEIVKRLKRKYAKLTNFDGHKKDYLCALYGRFRGRNSVSWDETQHAAKAWTQSIAYKPIGSVHELVRDDILEFDGKQLQESITRIGDLMRQVTNLKHEGQRLDAAVKRLDKLKRGISDTTHAYEQQVVHDLALAKMQVQGDDTRIASARQKIKEDTGLAEQHAARAVAEATIREGVDRSRIDLSARLRGIPAHGEKSRLEQTLARASSGAKATLESLSKSLIGAAHLDHAAKQLLGKPVPDQFPRLKASVEAVAKAIAGTSFDRLSDLRDAVSDALGDPSSNVDKLLRLPLAFEGANTGIEAVYRALAGPVDSVAAAISAEGAGLDSRITSAQSAVTELAERKARLASGGGDYPPDVARAVERMRDRLPDAHVQVLCDLIEPKSEEWQAAIESYLAGARFNLIVDPDFEAAAIEFLQEARIRAKVVQGADCLAKADADRVPGDSIIRELRTEHPIAEAFLIEMFGPVVKVSSVQQLRRTQRGLMLDGKGSGSRTMFHNEKGKLVLGRAARERALAACVEQLASAEQELERLRRLQDDLATVKRSLQILREPVFEANGLTEYASDIDHARRSLSQLDLSEIQELQASLDALERQMREHDDAIRQADSATTLAKQRIADAEVAIGRLNARREAQLVELTRQLQRLEHVCSVNPEKTYTVLSDECERLASAPEQDTAGIEREAARYKTLPDKHLGEVRDLLSDYNNYARQEERFPVALPHFYDATDFDPYYEPVATLGRAVSKLHADLDSLGLYRNRNELDTAERSFHDVFTKQFCVEIKTKVDDGIRSLRQLNSELSRLKFGSDRFSIDWSKWEPEFEEYYGFFKAVAEMADSAETVDLFDGSDLTNKEVEVRDRLVKLLLDTDQDRASRDLLRIADYRNYRRYEIWNESDSGGKIALSTWGTGSGGQLETPAYLVRAAVVTNRLKFFEKGPSLKLLVSDESFSKMDEPRARAVLGFLREGLGLQVISAMPTRSAGGLRPEFTREYSYSRANVEANGELDFVLECDERELRSDRMRELWAQERAHARQQAKQLFDASEPDISADIATIVDLQ